MKTAGYFTAMIVLTLGLLAGCTSGSGGSLTATPTVGIGIANPASTHCLDQGQGNKLEIRTAPDGGQYGVCIFPDGSECEEWAYYRGECSPGTSAPAHGNNSCEPHNNHHQEPDH